MVENNSFHPPKRLRFRNEPPTTESSLNTNIPAIQPDAWDLDLSVTFLNHGSFGACPRAVLERQRQIRLEMEREPVDFLVRKLTPLLDESRNALSKLVGADPADVVFVQNATAGVNSVMRSLDFRPGDEILVTAHDYNACRNAIRYVAKRTGAVVVEAEAPLPIASPQQVVDAVLERVTPRTRLAMLDHITSPTALIFPVEELVRELDRRGIDTLVDGAHAPGCCRWISVASERPTTQAIATNGSAPEGGGLFARPPRSATEHPAHDRQPRLEQASPGLFALSRRLRLARHASIRRLVYASASRSAS